ncbi:MAG TPA: dolichyl-phosphate-mannose-protein mannosyltransferase [Leptospiraceae bacterium]|nr:dolichyl-phosphate-mannose-protein mannosyltransferase [Leptospiraceae bacterium]HNF14490.1 dolichyl-phosphate-mannose-protein mannosyltransferase [Leptospiraceae bacterium]HNF24364.1 dolichyl-phosphate-mannose-protein mannosyltransferase [Leptospiraceae bacterium]HNI95276.1 dolichyl-phosphate-mannose-protein mannosyltransferase [Leptospiraceae bacterium]HNM06268.1 dolichyl-phosphate-mannose-protein mannosyltransferase [Leptospiraceae bacterium]
MINKKFFGMVFFLISISTLQRLIALYLDNNDLFAGDDPNTFYYQAVSFYESGVIKPNSGFSPGMSFYLLGMFKFFGIGQFFPKLIMIFLGSLGLLSLALFINSFFKSKAVSIVALLFYITSSHYVSFSNQFWNENLFHPAFSVFLYLTWKIFEEKKKSINQSINQSINLSIYLSIVPVIMLSLTLLRSWFPLPGLIWILFLFYTAYSNKLHFLKKTAIVSAGIIFLGLGLLYSDHYSSQKGVATSNSPINLLIGNNPYSQGTYTRHWVTFVRDYKINLEDKNYISQVININIDNPFIIVRNLKNKAFLWFLGAGGPRPISPYYQHPLLILQYFYRFTVFLLFLFGASFLFSHRKGKILVLLYFSVFMIHMIYFADYRFTLTAMPLQAIFVSFGVMRIMKRLSAWQSIFFQESRTE